MISNRGAYSRFLKTLGVFFILVSILSCERKNPIEVDSNVLCAAYQRDAIEASDISDSFFKADEQIQKKLATSIKTEEFQLLVAKMSEISFVRDVYPDVKQMIEDITDKTWSCADMERFYSLKVEKDGVNDSNLPEVKITVTSEGNYYFEDTLVDFSNVSNIPERLSLLLANKESIEVVIMMDKGAGDENLSGILSYLARNDIENVKVLSE